MHSTAGPAPDAPFSERLRTQTRAEHEAAEQSGFIGALLGGRRDEADYWRLVAQYLPIYEALEDAISAAAARDPLAAAFHDPRLARAEAIRADLAARFGPRPRVDPPLEVTSRYARRLAGAPVPALLAHHYLRYLGDLSGGQAIGALVARHYGVPPEQGRLWDFSALGSPKRYKDAYRERLDGIVDPAVQAAFLAEAKEGYRLAAELFDALER
ncbi:heme oxygenase (biliverdin-producing) [Brachybacterium phenoliresistens]|uniref:Heme oxygenase n=1 Tax=Brachybacterium phenoliresistens TaxID=396014 RepID=Z9JVS9_9MICO|nr:biliverdin-producing heme oxygenase [Brachybacterium phenoliresistens]EWS81901.1 heme oxygenase [Brachybacterium phenoliresistens]